MVHASSRCADIIPSSSSDSSIRDLPPFNTNASMKNTLGSSSQSALDFFANSEIPKEGTKNFQSYIGELLEKQIIKEPQLTRFIESLEKGELINPISKDEALTSTSLLVQRKGLQRYLDKSSLDQKELLGWSKAILEKRALVRVTREETQEETRDIHQKLEFHPVKRPVRFEMITGPVRHETTEPIRFEMIRGRNKKLVTLTYPIEVQSTPVTQKQWVEVMGENPSGFVKGEDTVVWAFHGKDIELQPDNPVESVTWLSMLEFANRLSEQHGFPPAYDLSGITWEPGTRPEDGTLRPENWQDEKRVQNKIRIYAKGKSYDPYEGDIYYQAEGYRLPTLAEQMYMLQDGGRTKDDILENEPDLLANHGWYLGNTGGRTHPVGLLRPMVIDGKPFYDLYGNRWELGWDVSSDSRRYSGKNPVGQKKTNKIRLPAVGLTDFPPFFTMHPHSQSSSLGFRLVRTIEQSGGEPGNSE